jgi:hypothetical protein
VVVSVDDAISPKLLDGEEFHTLQARFSSGVRLRELGSIATVIAAIAGLPRPNRPTRTHYLLLLQWLRTNWAVVQVWLPFITLLDDRGVPIDQNRESVE